MSENCNQKLAATARRTVQKERRKTDFFEKPCMRYEQREKR